MCLNHNKSANQAYRDTRIGLNLPVTSEDFYREITYFFIYLNFFTPELNTRVRLSK